MHAQHRTHTCTRNTAHTRTPHTCTHVRHCTHACTRNTACTGTFHIGARGLTLAATPQQNLATYATFCPLPTLARSLFWQCVDLCECVLKDHVPLVFPCPCHSWFHARATHGSMSVPLMVPCPCHSWSHVRATHGSMSVPLMVPPVCVFVCVRVVVSSCVVSVSRGAMLRTSCVGCFQAVYEGWNPAKSKTATWGQQSEYKGSHITRPLLWHIRIFWWPLQSTIRIQR
jgi:hypothetical protein